MLPMLIGGLGNLHADQMFRNTAEAEGESLVALKHV